MKKLIYLLSGFAALTFGLMACDSAEVSPDPVPLSVADSFTQPGMEDDFEAKAIKASGILEDLERDSYPLVLFAVGEDYLKAYVKAQGMTEEVFLSSPKLADFYKAQLAYTAFDESALKVSAVGTTKTLKSAADTDITILKAKNTPSQSEERNFEVNGAPSELLCYIDYNINPGDAQGRICYADAPVVENFDWSR